MRAAKTILLAWLIAGCHGAPIHEAGPDGGTAGRGGGSGAAGTGSGGMGTGTGGMGTGSGGAGGAGGSAGACARRSCDTPCTNGVCDVALLRTGGTSSQFDTMAAAVDGDRLYFAISSGTGSGLEVKSMPKQGGQEQSLFQQINCAPQGGAAPCELTVVVDDADVFFTGLNPASTTAVLAVPKGGGDVRTVCSTGNKTPGQLALEGSDVYWYRGANGIERCSKAGGGASTPAISATGNVLRTASRPGGVVWATSDTGVVTRLDTSTLSTSVLGVTLNSQPTVYPGVCDVVDDGTLAYWVLCSWPHIVYVEGTGNNPSELGRALAGTGPGSSDDYGSIGVDGNYVYFTEIGLLNRVPKTGGPVEPRAAVVEQNNGTIKARIIGFDEKYVYLQRHGGYLYRVVK
jgi:hypothetical protein